MPNKPLPASFDDMVVFLAVVRHGGFRDAARHLGLSPSTVSDTVARLEARMDLRLLNRTTRSLSPTEAGAALAERLAPLLREARDAVEEARSSADSISGTLKLNVPGAVMIDILPPLIERFMDLHPQVRVEITIEDSLVDLLSSGADAGVRYGEFMAQDMIAVPLGPTRQQAALAASPAYIARRGMPAHPRDLLDHDCIRSRFASGALTEWEFEKDGETLRIEPQSRILLSVTGLEAALGFARSGRGMMMTFRNWLEPEFGAGRLIPVLADWWPEFEGPFLYFPSRRYMPAALRAFVDLVRADRR